MTADAKNIIDDATGEQQREQQSQITVDQVLEALRRDDVYKAVVEWVDQVRYCDWLDAQHEYRVERETRFDRGLAALRALDPAVLEQLRGTDMLDCSVVEELERHLAKQQAEDEIPL